ncbi:hypothetical protein [Neorhizobium sp. DAR64872/K0K18]|uniref:hypothetical protein n=1 Tax=Neorhizobium sp. DAR64872/K0K18 TaxID=3421958 RepID=UPI003D2B2975
MLEVYPEEHLSFSDSDGGCAINVSENFVLLHPPGKIDLSMLWQEFTQTLRQEFRTLLVMEYGEVVQRYGNLNLNEKHIKDRWHTPFGLLSRGVDDRLHILENRAVVQALIKLGVVPALTPHGRPRQNIPRESGTVTQVLAGLPADTRIQVIDLVLSGDLDDAFRLSQRDLLGLSALKRTVLSRDTSTVEALRHIADQMERNVAPVPKIKGASAAKGTGRSYAPIWFSQFLAARGIWLFPMRMYDRLLAFWPDHFRPLLLTMSVPAHSRDIADAVLGSISRDLTSLRQVPAVFAMAALSSNMWSERRFCSAGLFHMKAHLGAPDGGRSASINHVYKFLMSCFDVDVLQRDEARLMDGRKNLSSIQAFRWVDYPSKSNLRKVCRILEREWSDVAVPQHTRLLAAEIRELLPTFKVQHMKQVRNAVELFLIYTLLLTEDRRVSRLRDIRRYDHVRSETTMEETFFEFLLTRCSDVGSHSARASISKMSQLWKAGALRDGYDRDLPCPFDTSFDRMPKKGGRKGRAGRALDQEVVDILIELNRKDDYGFARSLGLYEFNVRDVATGEYSTVFWPAVAIAADISLRTGHRLRSIRWLDSGEGDERLYDPVTMTDQPNMLSCAMPGRQMFAVRRLRLDDDKRTEVNAMYLCVAKGGPYETAYLPPELIEPICKMRDLQIRFNPMKAPVASIDNKDRVAETQDDLFAPVFPVLRFPGTFQDVVSDARARAYYKALLKMAQPIVNKRLGRDYPLVDLEADLVLATYHDNRRSFVTNNDEAGIPIAVSRVHLGHAADATTHKYNRVRDRRIHGLGQLATYDADLLEGLADNRPDALQQIGAQVEAVSGKDSPQASRFREMRKGGRFPPLDIFMHCLCLGGDCATGGRKGSQAIPVFRPRACGGCTYSGRTWAQRAGVVNRINLLKIELRMSGNASAELNRTIARLEADGQPVQALARNAASEETLRRNLANELRLEQDHLKRLDIAAKAARLAGRSPSSVVLLNSEFDLSKVETEERRVHDFEMLQIVMKDAVLIPAARVELPPVVTFELERQVRSILRANRLEHVLHRIPEGEKIESLVAIGDIFLDLFGEVEDFQRVLDDSAKDMPQPAIENLAAAIEEAATKPRRDGTLQAARLLNALEGNAS